MAFLSSNQLSRDDKLQLIQMGLGKGILDDQTEKVLIA